METKIAAPRVRVEKLNREFPLFLSAEKAARLIGISRPTVMRMIERGQIRAERSSANLWNVETLSVFEFLKLDAEMVVRDV